MRSLSTSFALACFLTLTCCPQQPVPPPVAVQGSDCAAACTKLVKLGCTPATTPDGHSCKEVCDSVEATGVISWHTTCITDIKVQTCAAVEACRK